MTFRAMLLLAACLSLGGCWRSTALLLNPAEGARAIPNGVYAKAGDDSTFDPVIWKGGGFYELQDEGSISIFTLTPLGEIGGRQAFAGAMADDGCQSGEAEDCEWDYAVVFVAGDGVDVAVPDCKDTSVMAQQFGARSEPDGSACTFASPAELKAALKAFAAQAGKLEHYRKLPDPLSR